MAIGLIETGLDPAVRLVLARVRLRARRRAAWLRKLWSEEGAPGGGMVVTHAEIDTLLDDRDAPDAEAAWFAGHDAIEPLNCDLADVETVLEADGESRLALLVDVFGLSLQEADVLQAIRDGLGNASLKPDDATIAITGFRAGRGTPATVQIDYPISLVFVGRFLEWLSGSEDLVLSTQFVMRNE